MGQRPPCHRKSASAVRSAFPPCRWRGQEQSLSPGGVLVAPSPHGGWGSDSTLPRRAPLPLCKGHVTAGISPLWLGVVVGGQQVAPLGPATLWSASHQGAGWLPWALAPPCLRGWCCHHCGTQPVALRAGFPLYATGTPRGQPQPASASVQGPHSDCHSPPLSSSQPRGSRGLDGTRPLQAQSTSLGCEREKAFLFRGLRDPSGPAPAGAAWPLAPAPCGPSPGS